MQCMLLNTSDASQVGYPHQILGEMEEKHQTQFQGDKVISIMPDLGQNNKQSMKVEAQEKSRKLDKEKGNSSQKGILFFITAAVPLGQNMNEPKNEKVKGRKKTKF